MEIGNNLNAHSVSLNPSLSVSVDVLLSGNLYSLEFLLVSMELVEVLDYLLDLDVAVVQKVQYAVL